MPVRVFTCVQPNQLAGIFPPFQLLILYTYYNDQCEGLFGYMNNLILSAQTQRPLPKTVSAGKALCTSTT